MDLREEARKVIDSADREMAEQFCRRMEAAAAIAAYKKERGLPVFDPDRERELTERCLSYVADPDLRSYYARFLSGMLELSRQYQNRLIGDGSAEREGPAVNIPVSLGERSYGIVLESGALSRAGTFWNLRRKVLIVTDEGVPAGYAEAVAAECAEPLVIRIPQGEQCKTLATVESLLSEMMRAGFQRGDCAVSVGGGVAGDLTGLTASLYHRGIDFYQVPTTVLAMADASVGGKTAVNLSGIKNVAGTFRQPRGVLIDPEVLKTLPKRQVANGLAEVVKIALTSDRELFERMEAGHPEECLPEILERAIRRKVEIVELDEREAGLRRILNFGHTVGHAIESVSAGALLHGECVALGMIPMCSPEVRKRLIPVLRSIGLPLSPVTDPERIAQAVLHDKKAAGDRIATVRVDTVGSCRVEMTAPEELREAIRLLEGDFAK
ncbi:MAG: iron-containing alcohol dehydrogenase [Clostridia bacterium]|nr:iron-containing alcohol dehydrogenase [Clostridia bacterium]